MRAAQRKLDERRGEDPSRPDDLIHEGEPDSVITPTAQGPFLQGYNAQAAVSAEGVTLMLGAHVVAATHDRRQLVPTVEAIPAALGPPAVVLADTGYDHGAQIEQSNQRGVQVHCLRM